MSESDEVKTALSKFGPGDWQLTLEDDTELELHVEEVQMDDEEGFHAEARDEEAGELYELTTMQSGGPVRLRRRAIREEEWEDLGAVVYAER